MRRDRWGRPLRSGGPVALAVLLVIPALAFGAKPAASDRPAAAAPPRCFGAASRDPYHRCINPSLDRRVSPTPIQAVLTPYAPCGALGRPGLLAPCRFGLSNPFVVDEIALVGDSHAGHWRAAVRAIATKERLRGTSLTRSGCPFTLATLDQPEPARTLCRRWTEQVIAWFGRHPEVQTVIVSDHSAARALVARGHSALAAGVKGYEAAWRALPSSVTSVVEIRDVPARRLRTLDCVEHAIAARLPAGTACAAPRANVLRPDPGAAAAHRSKQRRVHLADLSSYFCGRKLCFPVVGGALVQKDGNHLTTAFAQSLAPYLRRRLDAAVREAPVPGASRTGRAATARAAAGDTAAGDAAALCDDVPAGVTCREGRGQRTPGGGDKVSHTGWPAFTGVIWKVENRTGRSKTGGSKNDELLGHHGSDKLDGGAGRDVLWGDWDPSNNTTHQRDVLRGGPGNDYIYPSHGTATVAAGTGNDYVWAFYGHGMIDCGPGRDTVRVRMNGAFRLSHCEVVEHFCAFGSDHHGGCRKPGGSSAELDPDRGRRLTDGWSSTRGS